MPKTYTLLKEIKILTLLGQNPNCLYLDSHWIVWHLRVFHYKQGCQVWFPSAVFDLSNV